MFSPFFNNLESDPFFSAHQEHMRTMNRMLQDPFGVDLFRNDNAARVAGGGRVVDGRSSGRPQHQQQQLTQRDVGFPLLFADMGMMGGGLFGHMTNLMNDMQRQMLSMQSTPDAHCYSQQSVYTYSNDGRGQPKVFEAHSTTRTGPGGVKETKKAVRDSEIGIEKMAIGHHIGERGHVIQKSRDHRTGQIDEEEQLLHIDEEEKAAFDREWQNKTRNEVRDRALRSTRHAVAALPSNVREDYDVGVRDSQLAASDNRAGHRGRAVAAASMRRRHHDSSEASRRYREPL